MKTNQEIKKRVRDTQGAFFESLAKTTAEKVAENALHPLRAREKLNLLSRYVPGQSLRGLRMLEIGSGLGVLQTIARLEYEVDAWGLEPSGEGFDSAYDISLDLLTLNGLSSSQIANGVGEELPFDSDSFDIVYSTNVLEHSSDPHKVILEAVRVCRPGGVVQIVVPSYGTFYDGHYACFYIPYQPKWFWKLYLKHLLRRDPDFVDSLRTEINYPFLQKCVQPLVDAGQIEILTMGEEIFRERMSQLNFSEWGGIRKLMKVVKLAKFLGVNNLAAEVLVRAKLFTPLVLTIKKT
ncbi:MAG: methyltransferase domain-containing protein [Proteobacteria bacterium]|nr:methyltransferase domain-containing protein [Pseudomonadota bacterium]